MTTPVPAPACDEVAALLAIEALEGPDGGSSRLVAEHCSACAQCAALRDGYGDVAAMLVFGLPETPAAPEVRERLRLRLAVSKRRQLRRRLPGWPRTAALAAGFAFAFALGAAGATLLGGGDGDGDAADAEGEPFLASATEAQRWELRAQPAANGASGELFIDPASAGAVAYFRDLPALPQGMVYQFWFVRADGSSVNGHLFRPDARSEAVHLVALPEPFVRLGGVWLTMEPEGGSPRPTGPNLFVLRFQQ
ncbi:MAG: anti-sigma factor domain-containing protein [Tepidiformaceae bacterium]